MAQAKKKSKKETRVFIAKCALLEIRRTIDNMIKIIEAEDF